MGIIDVLPFLDNYDIWPFYLLALLAAVSVMMAKEFYEDRKRRIVDKMENSKPSDVLITTNNSSNFSLKKEQSRAWSPFKSQNYEERISDVMLESESFVTEHAVFRKNFRQIKNKFVKPKSIVFIPQDRQAPCDCIVIGAQADGNHF